MEENMQRIYTNDEYLAIVRFNRQRFKERKFREKQEIERQRDFTKGNKTLAQFGLNRG